MANGFEVLVTLDGKTFRGQAQNKKAAKAAAAKEALINNPHLLRSRLKIYRYCSTLQYGPYCMVLTVKS